MGFLPLRGNWSPERLVLAIPTLGLGTVILAFALGGGRRPIASAQVYGGPTDSEGPFRGRLLVVRESPSDGELAAWGDAPIEVVRRVGQSESRVQGRTGPDGWMELSLERRGDPETFELEVMSLLDGAVLGKGRPKFARERWAQASRRGLSLGQRQRARLSIEGAVLAVPFASTLELEPLGCTGDDSGAEGRSREWLRATGAELEQEGRLRAELASVLELGGTGPVRARITPKEHVVGLERGCSENRDQAKVSLTMPVVPGALHLSAVGEALLIEAPTPTETVWYTFVTEAARLEGGRLRLEADASGISRGRLPRSLVPEAKDLYLVLSTSPDGRSPSTVGYPLDGQPTTFDAIDGFLIDGAPTAEAREAGRKRRVVRALLGYVAALFTLSLWLFRLVVRRSDRRLLDDLRAGDAPLGLLELKGTRSSLVAGLSIALGLSLLLLWIAVFSEAG